MTDSPKASFSAVVGDFIYSDAEPTKIRRVQWDPINKSEPWVFEETTIRRARFVGKPDIFEFPDGGSIQGVPE